MCNAAKLEAACRPARPPKPKGEGWKLRSDSKGAKAEAHCPARRKHKRNSVNETLESCLNRAILLPDMLITLHAAIGVLLSTVITLQQRMTGLSATFGGSGATYVQRRGAESVLFKATVWLSVVFFALGVVQLFISQ